MKNCLVTLIYSGAFKKECRKHSCVELTREKEEMQNIISKQKIGTLWGCAKNSVACKILG